MSLKNSEERPTLRTWWICSLLFLATMLMYLDRQTLAQTILRIREESGMTKADYGWIEFGFGMAFAAGALFWGLIADRVNVRWLYPGVLIGWSLAGVLTALGPTLGRWVFDLAPWTNWSGVSDEAHSTWLGILVCRVLLGFFEAGHWPCALITTQRLLNEKNRTLGNSLLQSGATVGAVLTPPVVVLLMSDAAGSWRWPFVVVGVAGMSWIVPWLVTVGSAELRPLPAQPVKSISSPFRWQNFCVLLAVVIPINMTWQFYRAWLPTMLQEHYGYTEVFMQWFTVGFNVSADAGCLAVGAATALLGAWGWSAHRARVVSFTACALLTMTSLSAAFLPAGAMLLTVFLVVAAGTLGLFPAYYSLSQQLSKAKQGAVTGTLGATTWVVTSIMQAWIGGNVERTKSYATAITLVGLVPLVACLAIVLFWREED